MGVMHFTPVAECNTRPTNGPERAWSKTPNQRRAHEAPGGVTPLRHQRRNRIKIPKMTPVIERVGAYRTRQKTGAAVLPFVPVSDEIGTVEVFIPAGLLAESERDNRAAIAAAAGRFLDMAVKDQFGDV